MHFLSAATPQGTTNKAAAEWHLSRSLRVGKGRDGQHVACLERCSFGGKKYSEVMRRYKSTLCESLSQSNERMVEQFRFSLGKNDLF